MVVLVTGGSKRVGRAIVLEFARAGWDTGIHYRRSPALASEVAAQVLTLGRRARTVQGELTDAACWPNLIEQTLQEFGRLDCLVNSASMFLHDKPDTVEAFDASTWESMFATNVTAPMALSHFARNHLAESGQGSIVNLCDISAERPWAKHLAYCSSKAALVALTKGLAKALAPQIRVNGVSPGIAVFPESYSPDLRRRLTEQVPLRREGTPEEIARVVRFLAETAEYITGQIIAVDGGRSIV